MRRVIPAALSCMGLLPILLAITAPLAAQEGEPRIQLGGWVRSELGTTIIGDLDPIQSGATALRLDLRGGDRDIGSAEASGLLSIDYNMAGAPTID